VAPSSPIAPASRRAGSARRSSSPGRRARRVFRGQTRGYLADGTKVVARAAICATGVDYHASAANEERFRGAGVYYGAGAGEAQLCVGQHVVVVGSGNSAAQATLHFSRHAPRVTLVIRGDSLKSSVPLLIDRIYSASNVEVHTRRSYRTRGARRARAVVVTNSQTGTQRRIETHWLFVCIGGAPRTEWPLRSGSFATAGYLVTDRSPSRWART